MTKIYVVRHGQDQDNEAGILNGHRNKPLTDLGKTQAHESAGKLAALNIEFDHILSSPLLRAFETAEIIAQKLGGVAPKREQQLIERDFGIMTGKPTASIADECGPNIIETETVTYFLSPAGAETFHELLMRARHLLDLLQVHRPESTILLVTHGDLGKMLYAAYFFLEWEEVLKKFHFGNTELLELSPNTTPETAQVYTIKQHNS